MSAVECMILLAFALVISIVITRIMYSCVADVAENGIIEGKRSKRKENDKKMKKDVDKGKVVW